jgi:hypothetical protein
MALLTRRRAVTRPSGLSPIWSEGRRCVYIRHRNCPFLRSNTATAVYGAPGPALQVRALLLWLCRRCTRRLQGNVAIVTGSDSECHWMPSESRLGA